MAEVKGVVKLIGPVETVGQNNFQKQQVVLSITKSWGGQNPGSKEFPVPVLFTGKTIDKVKNIAEGQEVTVSYDLEGREYNGKYYLEAKAWDIKVEGSAPSNLDRTIAQQPSAKQVAADDPDNSLPF